MELTISNNSILGGIHIKSNHIRDKTLFFKMKHEMEIKIGLDGLLGGGRLSYKSYHPFGAEPLWYSIGDTVRGKKVDEIVELIKDIEGLKIITK